MILFLLCPVASYCNIGFSSSTIAGYTGFFIWTQLCFFFSQTAEVIHCTLCESGTTSLPVADPYIGLCPYLPSGATFPYSYPYFKKRVGRERPKKTSYTQSLIFTTSQMIVVLLWNKFWHEVLPTMSSDCVCVRAAGGESCHLPIFFSLKLKKVFAKLSYLGHSHHFHLVEHMYMILLRSCFPSFLTSFIVFSFTFFCFQLECKTLWKWELCLSHHCILNCLE